MYSGGSNGNDGNGNNGNSYIPLYDNNGNVRMALGVKPNGEPNIIMRDKNGVERLIIGLANGQPTIAFCNEKGEPCFMLNQNTFSFGEDGKNMFEMIQSANGGLCVQIGGKNGKCHT